MNSPFDDQPQLRYAEYVLGVLDADQRAEVAREIASSDEAAVAVALWQQRLLPLTEEIAGIKPPARVWQKISAHIAPATPASTRSVRLWQWLTAGATALALACLVMLFRPPTGGAPGKAPIPYMAATITQTNGQVGWTATMDIQRAQMIIVPASPQAFAAGHAPELWLIPKGGKPLAVGVMTPDGATTLPLSANLMAELGPTATLAVSVEPATGSPTGQPTGPVIASGAVTAAGSPSNHAPLAWLSVLP